MKLSCNRCGKRLSRKTARLIDGEVMCSACMFAPASVDERAKRRDPQGLDPEDASAVPAQPGDAQTSSSEEPSNDPN